MVNLEVNFLGNVVHKMTPLTYTNGLFLRQVVHKVALNYIPAILSKPSKIKSQDTIICTKNKAVHKLHHNCKHFFHYDIVFLLVSTHFFAY